MVLELHLYEDLLVMFECFTTWYVAPPFYNRILALVGWGQRVSERTRYIPTPTRQLREAFGIPCLSAGHDGCRCPGQKQWPLCMYDCSETIHLSCCNHCANRLWMRRVWDSSTGLHEVFVRDRQHWQEERVHTGRERRSCTVQNTKVLMKLNRDLTHFRCCCTEAKQRASIGGELAVMSSASGCQAVVFICCPLKNTAWFRSETSGILSMLPIFVWHVKLKHVGSCQYFETAHH